MKTWLLLGVLFLATMVGLEGRADAATGRWVVYLHGRGEGGWGGGLAAPEGWGTVDLRYNATTATLAQANAGVTDGLRRFCSGDNVCIVVAYSNGSLQIGRTLAVAPDAVENLLYVQGTGAAMGGSELASDCKIAEFFTKLVGQSICYPTGVDATLTPSGARAAYDHNSPRPWYLVGGRTGALNWIWYATSLFLPGSHDGVVAYHSAFGCTQAGRKSASCAKFQGLNLDPVCAPCRGAECGGDDHFAMKGRGAACF
mgnify:CR=1 FL=1|jgi:hypothetical protein